MDVQFILHKMPVNTLRPCQLFASRNHSFISWTNCIKRKLKKHAKQGTVRMFKWTFDLTTRNITVRNKTFIQCSYICRSIEIWDRERIANIRLIWIARSVFWWSYKIKAVLSSTKICWKNGQILTYLPSPLNKNLGTHLSGWKPRVQGLTPTTHIFRWESW